ncbi:MAG: cation:proton antiporter [Verrucomicrobiales bacterium]|nr:cation:proton antiporter [Verrucomicrobiales bacterium]
MHLDPILPKLFALVVAVLIVDIGMRFLKQPLLVGFILVGIVLGPSGVGLIDDSSNISQFGNLGVVLLLFYLGMEISIPHLIRGWKIAVIGTSLQIGITLGLTALVGQLFGWSTAKVVLFGFMLALSSTAVILRILKEKGENFTTVGRNVTGVLLVQDLMLAPIVIILGFLSGESHFSPVQFAGQSVGLIAMVAGVIWIAKHGAIELPFANYLRENREIQVYAAMAMCFGFALLTGILGLSTALGAFIGGIAISQMRGTKWVRESLESFHIFFLGLFFVSIGLLVDVPYVFEQWERIALMVAVVMIGNTLINSLLFKALGESWRDSFYSGSLLSQIGEFSFILAAIGLQAKIITSELGYQTALSVITITLLISPCWIAIFRRITGYTPENSP